MSTSVQEKQQTGEGSAPQKVHPAFEWLRSQRIDSLNLEVEVYQHRKTGAQHFHLAADNPENVFLVALRTIPMDSTGVAHILEHTALCGSERYPVRDPFFMMVRRSLNTFMNAFTSSDWTAYPFASQNRKDFNNLLDVYLDAVFFSRLDELDFAQEGHRIEFERPEDPESPLVYKGVVFNEMKGAMSSPVSTLWQTLTRHLFPTTTYHYNSGGEPENIPDLSYDELKSFYQQHYHPSNSIIMTYGDIPAIEHQEKIDSLALSKFERLEMQMSVDFEQRYSAPLRVAEHYAFDDAEQIGDQTHIVMGWLLGTNTNLEDAMKAHILAGVLLDNGSCPLRFALENTQLGTAPSPLCGVEDSNHEMSFICGIEGTNVGNEDAVEKLVLEVLKEVVANGIPQDRIEAILHQLELSQREVSGDGYPYGLHLIMDCLPFAVHRGDPVEALNLDPVIEKLRNEAKDPDFIKNLVQQLLLDNPHRVLLTLEPDATLSASKERAEAQRLQQIKQSLSEQKKQEIILQSQRLAERQLQEDDPDILPKVGLEDIPAEVKIVEGTTNTVARWPVSVYEQGTNGIIYQQLIVELPELEDELQQVLPYYTTCLTELGAGDMDYLTMQARQTAVSGGIHAYSSVRGAIDNEQQVNGHFILSGKALLRNSVQLTELFNTTFTAARFDEHARIREIMAQQRAHQEQSVTGNGHGLAMMAAISGMSPVAAFSHRLRGLAGIHTLKQLDDQLDDTHGLSQLADKFARIHNQIINAPRQFLLVTEADRSDQCVADMNSIWSSGAMSEAGPYSPFTLPGIRSKTGQVWLANTQVNFIARAYPTVAADHPDAAVLRVLAGFLRNGYLHRAIREQGGAYGGGASQDSDNASFKFFSYRDPRLVETLTDFDRSIDWLLNDKHEWRQVEEAILGVIGALDKPGSPAGEAKKSFHDALYGRTREHQQKLRERILQVKLDDLKRVGEIYFNPEVSSTAVVTNINNEGQCKDLGLDIYKL